MVVWQRRSTLALMLTLTLYAPSYAVVDSQQTNETADLLDMPLENLLEVEVTSASKKSESLNEAPAVMTVVPRDEIRLFGDRDLHQLLQRQPSIYTRDVFPYTDNVAGFRGDMGTVTDMHTLILLNGRPIRESAQGLNVNMYKTFPLSILDSVELIRGPGSVLYGSNAFTGVINLKTRVPDHNEFSVSSMMGSYGYYQTNVTAAAQSGDFRHVTAFQVVGEQGYPYQMTDALGAYGEDDRQYKSYSATTHVDFGNLTFDCFWSDYDAFAMGVMPFWSNPHKSFRDKKLFVNAGYKLPIHERATLEFNATYNLQENGLTSYKPQIIGTNTSDWLFEGTLYLKPTDNLNIVTGALQEIRSNYHPTKDKFQSIPPYRHEPKSFYAQGDYKFNKLVKLVAGTQWNKSSYGFSDWISRFGAIITLSDNWGVKLLRGEAFRAPTTLETDLYDPGILVGNSNLQPEKITTYDAQIFYNTEKTFLAFTYFRSTIDGTIVYDTAAVPTMSYKNGGKHRFNGIELEGKYFCTPGLQLLASFMHQSNEAQADVNPTVVPRNMFKLGTAYSWQWGTAALSYLFFGKPPQVNLPSTLVANPKPQALHLVNLNIDFDLYKWTGLKKGSSIFTFRVENLFNQKVYVPTLAYSGSPNSFPYGPGTTFYGGVTFNF
jgi:outer membrane receptor for ferrienterochelin and colicins